jgi:hypothetical protein
MLVAKQKTKLAMTGAMECNVQQKKTKILNLRARKKNWNLEIF